jgi:hypothetical protein
VEHFEHKIRAAVDQRVEVPGAKTSYHSLPGHVPPQHHLSERAAKSGVPQYARKSTFKSKL